MILENLFLVVWMGIRMRPNDTPSDG